MRLRTQVAIVGAGPAGLSLAHLLHLQGIESILIEAHSRHYVEHRVRAGVLEQGTVDLLCGAGVGERVRRQGLLHRGIELRFGGRRHRIDFAELLDGRAITVYGQQELVKDLIAARLAAGGQILFEASVVSLHGIDSSKPYVRVRQDDAEFDIECGVIAGCDGFHGVCRQAMPPGAVKAYERAYPFAWLGVLAHAPPSSDELIYAHHDRGFALFSMRSPEIGRLYIQVDPEEALARWPDERIWEELRMRGATDGDWTLPEGPLSEKAITGMRSYVVEPMQYGKLFLVGDAAHIVPPTGAKGLNLAVADARVLAAAAAKYFAANQSDLLDSYSARCLKRIWRAEHFSWWMTSMLHRFPQNDSFQQRLQRSQLDYVVGSRVAAASLAENYVGLPFDYWE